MIFSLYPLLSGNHRYHAASGLSERMGVAFFCLRCPQTPWGKCAVGDGFWRRGCGSPCQSSTCTWARTRRRRPAGGRGARSQKPVGRAGGVAAVYARMLPARRANAGRRCRRLGAKTTWRAAPSLGFAQSGRPATGQRSRDIACACAPLSVSAFSNWLIR